MIKKFLFQSIIILCAYIIMTTTIEDTILFLTDKYGFDFKNRDNDIVGVIVLIYDHINKKEMKEVLITNDNYDQYYIISDHSYYDEEKDCLVKSNCIHNFIDFEFMKVRIEPC